MTRRISTRRARRRGLLSTLGLARVFGPRAVTKYKGKFWSVAPSEAYRKRKR